MRPRYPRWLQVVIGPSELAFCVAAWAVGTALGTAHACYLLAMAEDADCDLDDIESEWTRWLLRGAPDTTEERSA